MERDRLASWTTGLLIAVAVVGVLSFDFWGASRTEPSDETEAPESGRSRRETAPVRSIPQVAATLPATPREGDGDMSGRFTLLRNQGFLFATRTVVTDRATAADVWATDDGSDGPASLGLSARGGIVSVREAVALGEGRLDAAVLYARVAGLALDELQSWRPTHVGHARRHATDVFLICVTGGGFAKLRILHRGDGGDSTKAFPVTIQYEYAPDGAHFGAASGDLRTEHGIVFGGPTPSTLAAFAGGGSWTELPALRGEGDVPDPYATDEILLADGSGANTYSFEVARRSVRSTLRVAHQLHFGRSGLSVNPVGGGPSTITWSGNHPTWDDVARTEVLPQAPDVRAAARRGALYYVQTRGSTKPRDTLVLGTAYVFKEQFAFEWISLANGRFTQSPTLTASPAVIAKLKVHLRRLARGGRQFEDDALTTAAARKTLRVLTISPPSFEFEYGARLGKMLDLFTRAGTPAVLHASLPQGSRNLRLEVDPNLRCGADLLDAATRQHGLGWTIDKEGRVVIVQVSLVR